MSVDTLSIVLKAMGYIALLQGVGIVLFLAIFELQLDQSVATIRRMGVVSVLLAIVALVSYHLLESARMTGEYAGMMAPTLQSRVLASPLGAATSLRVLGAILMTFGLTRRTWAHALLGVMGAAMAATSFLLVGHSVTHQPRWLLVPLLELHVLVAAFWTGSIMPLGMVARQETETIACSTVERFSAMAAILVPAMAVVGLAMAWILTGGHYSLSDPYDASLTGKVGLLALALILAALNRWRFGPALASGTTSAIGKFSRSLVAEYFLLTTIIALTATLTNLFSPAH